MTLFSKVVTLTDTAAAISGHDLYAVNVWLQPDGGNSGAVYWGPSGMTSDTGIYLGIPATSVPPDPLEMQTQQEQPINLKDIYVLGTADEKLRVMAWVIG